MNTCTCVYSQHMKEELHKTGTNKIITMVVKDYSLYKILSINKVNKYKLFMQRNDYSFIYSLDLIKQLTLISLCRLEYAHSKLAGWSC